MSEKAPASERPKPRPPTSSRPQEGMSNKEMDHLITRIEDNLNKSSEPLQPELESAVNAVEDIAVDETPEAPAAVTTAVLGTEAPAETPKTEATDIEALEKMFAGPAAETTTEATEVLTPSEAVAPKRGELTHHDYHAQRPSEGIYRSGNSFKRTAGGPLGGKFASKEEYEEQTGIREYPNGPDGIEESARKHYDEVTGVNETKPEISERPEYEKMDTDQLVFAAAKAELIGDKAVTDQIRETFEEEYTKPGSKMTYEDYESAVAQFDRLVEIAVEYEKAKDPEHYELVDAAVERANREPSIGDKIKKFWKKGVESAKKLFRPGHFAEMWIVADQKRRDGIDFALNYGVKPEDDDEETERKRKRNRRFLVAGAAALGVAALGTSFGLGLAAGSGGHHVTEAAGSLGGGHAGGGNTLSAHDQAIADALTPHRGTDAAQQLSPNAIDGANANAAAEAAKHAQTAAEAIPSQFTIQPGQEGGEQLFRSLDISPAKWYENQEHLLSISEGHMYRMADGNVGLRPGLLPDAVRNAIDALK